MTMTVTIACDDCGASAETSTSHDSGANEIDGVLDDGWEHEGGEDYCPTCVDARISRRIDSMPDYPDTAAGGRAMSSVVCPTCGAGEGINCSTVRGNDHRKRILAEIAELEPRVSVKQGGSET